MGPFYINYSGDLVSEHIIKLWEGGVLNSEFPLILKNDTIERNGEGGGNSETNVA